jgi:dTDP-4-dehydrorhamnose 3,5-epimerase-like enzyme
MIEFIERYFTHSDDRGTLEGLVNFGTWKEINMIDSDAGIERGNHYHKETGELFIVLDGEILVTVQKIENGELIGDIEKVKVKKGDVFLIKPMLNHIFYILKKSRWINVLSKPIDDDDKDIHRVKNNTL